MGMDGLGLEKSRCFHSWPPHRVSKTWIGGPCRTPNLGGWNVAWIKGDSDRGLPIMECTLWKAWPYYGTHIFRDSIWEFQVEPQQSVEFFFATEAGRAGNGGDGGMVILEHWACDFFPSDLIPKAQWGLLLKSSSKIPQISPKVSGTKNEATEPYNAILGRGFSIT